MPSPASSSDSGRTGSAGGTHRSLPRRLLLCLTPIVVLVLAHGPILTGVARLMTVETPIERADLIVPLYQDPEVIPAAAAAWFRRGYARQVALYRPRLRRLEAMDLRPPANEVMRSLLESHGVPPDVIVEIGHDVDSEDDLAAAIAGFLTSRPRPRVLVVASAPRSRLTWRPLHDALEERRIELRLDAVPPSEFDERTWWTTRDGLITYFDSYVLWLLRLVR